MFSTGTWSSDNGCGDGYKRSEWLHCEGVLRFDIREPANAVEVRVKGVVGNEQVELLLDGVKVADHNVSNFYTTWLVETPTRPRRVEVKFINDGTNVGVDKNVRVDWIKVNGQTYQTEDPSVFSTGTWSSDNGCGDGYKRSEWLHCNGFLRFDV